MAEEIPNPIDEQITEAIYQRLRTITVANGYSTDELKPKRMTQVIDDSANQGDCFVAPVDERRGKEPLETPYDKVIQWVQTYHIRVFAKVSDNRDTPVDRVLARFAADIRKAVMRPDEPNGARGSLGGLAMQTIPLGRQWSWVKPFYVDVIFDVHYRTFASDPYKFTD